MRVAFLALAVVLVVVGCTQATPTPTATPIPQFLKDAAEQAPFEIVLPTFLPHGMKLTNADILTPPPGMSEEGRRRNTQALLRFANADSSAVFFLYESIAVSSIGGTGAVATVIGGVEGMMMEDKERQFLSLAWPGDGIGYVLTAFMTGTLTNDEVTQIAASTLAP